MTAPRHILVATDFSPVARRALDFAIALALPCGATVTLLHVYELPKLSSPRGVVTEIFERIVADAEQSMSDCLAAVREKCPKIEGVVREGVPWDRINTFAAERGSDLIVIGTHGRHGIARALIGSVAEKVVRTASVPVVTVGPERPAATT